MHDIRTIRDNPAAFDAALSRRGMAPMSSDILAIDEARRTAILAAETAQAEANKAAKEVGAAKGRGDEAEFERLRALVAEKKAEIAALNELAKAEDTRLNDLLIGIPNLPADGVPEGADENDNVHVSRWTTPRVHEVLEVQGTVIDLDGHIGLVGDPAPSAEDLAITRQLVFAAAVMGITVHEHIVIGDSRYFSFADHAGFIVPRETLRVRRAGHCFPAIIPG